MHYQVRLLANKRQMQMRSDYKSPRSNEGDDLILFNHLCVISTRAYKRVCNWGITPGHLRAKKTLRVAWKSMRMFTSEMYTLYLAMKNHSRAEIIYYLTATVVEGTAEQHPVYFNGLDCY